MPECINGHTLQGKELIAYALAYIITPKPRVICTRCKAPESLQGKQPSQIILDESFKN